MKPNLELIIDLFAGGGGASTGIEMALGRSPDVAINHDPAALAMHMANHPHTIHLNSNVWRVDPADAVREAGKKAGWKQKGDELPAVGLLWASPDCKHFSKAKGGKPVSKNIRDLAWIVVLWAKRVRPRVIHMENVEEFQDWGPLLTREDGKEYPDPARKGEIFKRFVGELKRQGYAVEWRQSRASQYAAPTIRRRLLLIARCDGKPIVWPAPTHDEPKAPAVLKGEAKPWRTAAEIIDWSLPCPSIFMTREEAAEYRRQTGIKVNRPLAEATMARIARGVKRYVLDAAQPFIVPVTHAGDFRANPVSEPLRTQTTARRGEHALITPFVSKWRNGATGHRIDEPLHTITSHHSETHPAGAAPLGIVTPFLARTDMTSAFERNGINPPHEPLRTQTTAPSHAVVSPFLVPRYGERPGQDPRAQSIETPLSTVVPTGNGASVVAAFLAQHNTDVVGHDVRKPLSTITAGGQMGVSQQGLIAAHMLNMKGSERQCYGADEPIKTLCAEANHAATVSAFLMKYYGEGGQWQGVGEPIHTITTKDRLALVTVMIDGEPYVIVDIGMRMLTARERFRAQGFPDSYKIDVEHDGKPLSGEAQGRMCGNSVSPPWAAAHIRANVPELAVFQ